jgi:uncharacterized membrane-anchored protein
MMIGLGTIAQANNASYPETQEAIDQEIITLPWEYEMKEYSLEKSNSTFKLSEGFALLRGDAARRFDYLTQGMEDPDTEALIYNQDTEIQLIFNYYSSGYVSVEDWGDLDADELLKQITENTEKGNEQRAQHNFPSLKIGGWIQKPRLNPDNNSVSWVFDVIDGEEKYVNAISIKLGRKGYEKITWVSSYENYLKSMDLMASLVDRQNFHNGHRYADYSMGDKIAAFGIASLVAVTAGGNQNAKAGLLAGLLAFGKKLLVPVIIALGAIGAFFRKLFGGKKPNPKMESTQI